MRPSLRASIILALPGRALEANNAEPARRIVAQVVEEAVLSDQVVEEVDNVVQVGNEVGQVTAIVVAPATTSEPASTVTPPAPCETGWKTHEMDLRRRWYLHVK